jgi:PRC-barrel domain
MKTFWTIAAIVLTAALPAAAQEGKNAIDPSKQPTSTMTDQVPLMKRDAEAVKKAGPDADLPLPADKAVGEAVPSMKPGDPVSGQPQPKTAATASNDPAKQFGDSFYLSEDEGKSWISKPVYSSDGKQIGSVAGFQRGNDTKVIGMQADVGGMFGFWRTRVNVTTAQFDLKQDRVVLSLPEAQVKDLPKVAI